MSDSVSHIPVMLDQVLELLAPAVGEAALDCTVGRGGHSSAILQRLGAGGRLIGLDADPDNAAFSTERLKSVAEPLGATVDIRHANFGDADAVLKANELPGVDVLLADLGFASNQMDDPDRGFSFQADGPLDMRLDPTLPETAADLLKRLPEREIADLIYNYGEERFSRAIARKIVDRRHAKPMSNTRELADLCCAVYGPRARRQKIHPATRTFQALRIAVNDELGRLEALLSNLPRLMRPGGRVGIISFHSLEDRAVKQAFRQFASEDRATLVTRKPARPIEAECRDNPRARSAKLRVLRWDVDGTT